jgi:hypothetical protein
MNMRLIGARTLKEVVPEMVDAHNIHSHIVSVPGDRLYDSNCASPFTFCPVVVFGCSKCFCCAPVVRREHAACEVTRGCGQGEVVRSLKHRSSRPPRWWMTVFSTTWI